MSNTEDQLSRFKLFKLVVLKRHVNNYKRGACAVLDFEFLNFKFNKKRPRESISKFIYLNSKTFKRLVAVASVLLEGGGEVVFQSKKTWKREAALTCMQRYAGRHGATLQVSRL